MGIPQEFAEGWDEEPTLAEAPRAEFEASCKWCLYPLSDGWLCDACLIGAQMQADRKDWGK